MSVCVCRVNERQACLRWKEYTSMILVCVERERERELGVFEDYTSRVLVWVCVWRESEVWGV